MIKKLFIELILLLIIFIQSTFCQENKNKSVEYRYNSFINQYKNEIKIVESQQELESSEITVILPDILPDWFFEPIISPLRKCRVLGVSDPGLDSITAFNQALFRAKIIASIQNKTFIGFITDSYKKESIGNTVKYSEVYGRFYRMSNKIPHCSDYVIVNMHRTKYAETIILIDLNVSEFSNDSLYFIFEGFIEEKTFGNDIDNKYKISLSSGLVLNDNLKHIMDFDVTGINNAAVFNSIYLKDSIIYPRKICYYDINKKDIIDDSVFLKKVLIPITMNYGLWNAYYQSVVRNIFYSLFRNSNIISSKLNDDYINLNQHFKHEIGHEYFKAQIHELSIYNKKLIVNLEIKQ